MRSFSYFIITLLFAAPLFSAEQLGDFSLGEYYIEADMVMGQDSYQASGFHMGRSYFSVDWQKDGKLGGELRVGTEDLNENPKWYNTSYEHKSPFTLSYAFYQTDYGKIKLGLQELPFGVENHKGIALRDFEESLFHENRFVSYSDLGLGLEKEGGGYKTQFLIHNGYGLKRDDSLQNDDKYFFSVSISKENLETGSLIGMSAQAGQYSLDSETANHKLKMYDLFFVQPIWGSYLSLEFVSGEDKVESSEYKFSYASLGLRVPITGSLSVAIQAENLEPSNQVKDDEHKASSFAFLWNDKNANSRLKFIYRETQQGEGQKDKIVMLAWRLSSIYNRRY